jgi:hypothetical protein
MPSPPRDGRLALPAKLQQVCLEAADGCGETALLLAIRAVRWQLLAAGELEPFEDEPLPDALVRQAA